VPGILGNNWGYWRKQGLYRLLFRKITGGPFFKGRVSEKAKARGFSLVTKNIMTNIRIKNFYNFIGKERREVWIALSTIWF
jgi:hypothetical protein